MEWCTSNREEAPAGYWESGRTAFSRPEATCWVKMSEVKPAWRNTFRISSMSPVMASPIAVLGWNWWTSVSTAMPRRNCRQAGVSGFSADHQRDCSRKEGCRIMRLPSGVRLTDGKVPGLAIQPLAKLELLKLEGAQ